jgi:hypothetical protein
MRRATSARRCGRCCSRCRGEARPAFGAPPAPQHLPRRLDLTRRGRSAAADCPHDAWPAPAGAGGAPKPARPRPHAKLFPAFFDRNPRTLAPLSPQRPGARRPRHGGAPLPPQPAPPRGLPPPRAPAPPPLFETGRRGPRRGAAHATAQRRRAPRHSAGFPPTNPRPAATPSRPAAPHVPVSPDAPRCTPQPHASPPRGPQDAPSEAGAPPIAPRPEAPPGCPPPFHACTPPLCPPA